MKIQILADTTDRSLQEKIVEMVDRMERLSTNEKQKIISRLEDEILGYGAIQPFLNDDAISEIMINGLNSFYVESDGMIENRPPIFESMDHLMQLIYRIAAEVGREINQSRPILDARLSDGSRVNVILNPIAIYGPIVTIRKFNKTITDAIRFVASGTFTEGLNRFMLNLVKSRYNLFISGGTGTGKTTLLNYIAQSIPREERIITIEDAAEIDIERHPHVVAMEMRNSTREETSSASAD